MTKKRKFDSKTKINVLKRHLQKKEPISNLCEEHGFTPGSLYQWQDTLFSRGHMVFENRVGRPVDSARQNSEIAELKKRLAAKDSVISELTEVLVREKKFNGATSV